MGKNSDSIKWCETSGKKSYGTKKQALTAASSTSKMRGTKLVPYKCPHCGDFHLTKNLRERSISGGSLIER